MAELYAREHHVRGTTPTRAVYSLDALHAMRLKGEVLSESTHGQPRVETEELVVGLVPLILHRRGHEESAAGEGDVVVLYALMRYVG
jgi:hypothetical protein